MASRTWIDAARPQVTAFSLCLITSCFMIGLIPSLSCLRCDAAAGHQSAVGAGPAPRTACQSCWRTLLAALMLVASLPQKLAYTTPGRRLPSGSSPLRCRLMFNT
jgi:hypothetical protein